MQQDAAVESVRPQNVEVLQMSKRFFVGALAFLSCLPGFADEKSPAELAKLATVIKPSAAANKWQQIPWLTDLSEARKLAAEEKRPLFLWTVFGEPLDEC